MICAVENCGRAAEKRSWCGAHYYRWRMHGSPTGGRLRNGTALKFLNDFVDPETDECVLWPYSSHGNGYGSKIDPHGYPHQIICRKFHGAVPTSEHEVAHHCGNRRCINPRHVRWATPLENNNDRKKHGTTGHKLTAAKVRQIKARPQENRAELASEFDVDVSTIWHIRSEKTWGWVK